jgi:hypothetical protein
MHLPVFIRFSFLSRGDSDKDRVSAIPMVPMWIDGLSPFYYTKLPSLRGDLARHEGCRPKSLNLCLDSRMGSYWPRKKSNLLDSNENEAQDKRTLKVKDAAKGYLTPEEPNESQIIRKMSFNFSCLNNHSENSAKVEVLPSDQRRSFNNSRGLEIESRVHFANLKLAL